MMKFIIAVGLLSLAGCGESPQREIIEIEKPIPIPCQPGGDGGNQGTSWTKMRNLFNKNCIGCHGNDPFSQSETAMRDPRFRVEAKIRNRSMPPNQNAMSEIDRTAMLNFF